MPKLKTSQDKEAIAPVTPFEMAMDLLSANIQIKKLTKTQTDLKTKLREIVEKAGKVTAGGNKELQIVFMDNVCTLTMQKRTTTIQDDDAIDLILKGFPKELSAKLVETVPTIRTDVLEQLMAQGALDAKQTKIIEKCFHPQDSYAFLSPVIKRKDELTASEFPQNER